MSEQILSNDLNGNTPKNVEHTIAGRAKIIQIKLKQLQKDCLDVETRKTISVEDIILIMEYMIEHLAGDNSALFEGSFIGHMKVMAVLADDMPNGYSMQFKMLTDNLCNLCPQIESNVIFFFRVLRQWRFCLEHISQPEILEICKKVNVQQFQKIAKCLVKANSNSMQHIMLIILFTYFKNVDKPSKWIAKVFEPILLKSNDLQVYIKAIESDTFVEQQNFLYQLNKRLFNQKIFSEMFDHICFDNEIINTTDVQYVHFNEKTIEFWIIDEDNPIKNTMDYLKVVIGGGYIKKIRIKDCDSPYVDEIFIDLKAILRIENKYGTKYESEKFKKVRLIKLQFTCGFQKKQLNELLLKMFNMEPEWFSEPMDDDSSDSDVEIIESIPLGSSLNATSIGEVINDDKMKTDFCIRVPSPDLFDLIAMKTVPPSPVPSFPVPSFPVPSSPVLFSPAPEFKMPLKRPKRKWDEPVATIDLRFAMDNEPSPKKSLKPELHISTTSFYSRSNNPPAKSYSPTKPNEKQTKKQNKLSILSSISSNSKRPLRMAAEKAKGKVKEIVKEEASVYEFILDPVEIKTPQKRRATKRQLDELRSSLKTPIKKTRSNGPRKLYNNNTEIIDVDDEIEEPKQREKWKSVTSNHELTPQSFKSSQLDSTIKLNQQVFKNMDKINANANERDNKNVSFSYRRSAAAQRQPLPDSTIASVADELVDKNHQSNGSDDENFDTNGNVKRCVKCRPSDQAIVDGLKETSNGLKAVTEVTKKMLKSLTQKCNCVKVD